MRRSMMAMLLCIPAACTPAPGGLSATAPVTTVQARLASVSEVGLFIGDVEEVGYSYTLAPLDTLLRPIVAIAREPCPAAPGPDPAYELTLQRQRMTIALREGQDSALISDRAVLSCRALPR
ncbi:hypothetical protein [Stakelama tenebrarum]|uniref:Lipoprotein n=1 Tax=Stakelama tenebrarum TaxID=2711215 RepID=A0A6G6Y2V5_9SPHN|nr:hypothetical protein [Sphingosinithalassobacter tenebrarum]QIG79230.1 hypothetical protein G5C33_05100 [Sphingosinithalassobacter tenebrarum]